MLKNTSILLMILCISLQSKAFHVSLGYFAHPFKEESRTYSFGVKHFFMDDSSDTEVGAHIGGIGLMTGKEGSMMGVLSPISFAPNTTYSIGVDLFIPIINKSQYDKALLGIGINFSL